MKEKETKTFSIIGNCTLRDCFDIAKNMVKTRFNYKFNSFFQYISLFSMYSKKPSSIDLKDDNLSYGTPWQKKCYKADVNRQVIELTNFESDYLLIDIAHNRLNLLQSKKDNRVLISSSILYENNKTETETYCDSEFTLIKPYNLDKNYISDCLKRFANDLKSKFDESKIIICELYSAEDYLNYDGTIKNFIEDHEIPVKNKFIQETFNEFIKHFSKAHIIEMPKYVLGNYKHKWGPHPLHFCDEYYAYLLECVDIICSQYNKKTEILKLKNLKKICENKFLNKRNNLLQKNQIEIFDKRERKKFTLLGSCVVRDLFEIGNNIYCENSYVINSFWSLSTVSAFSKPINKLKKLSIEDFIWGRNWQKKCIITDINRAYISESNFESDFVLVDLAFTKIDVAQFKNHPGSYFTANIPFVNNIDLLKNTLNEDVEFIHALDIPENIILNSIKTFAKKLKEKISQTNIIFIELDLAYDYFDKTGFITKFPDQDKIRNENELLKKAYDCFLNEFPNCHIIKMPNNVLAYELHKWGLLNLHYCNEFYDYLIKAIDVICCNYSLDKEKLELEYLKSACERVFTDRRRIIELKSLVHKQMEQKQQLNNQINDLDTKVQPLELNNSKLNDSLQNQIKENQELQKQILDIKSSKSYKIGNAITYIPRKIFKRKKTI